MASKHPTGTIPHTIAGQTAYIDAEPIKLPHDWDRTIRSGITAATTITVTAAVIWGAASIGDLLARAVHPAIAYVVAGIFSLAWITCIAAEWIARYDKRRARPAAIGGWIALAIDVAALFTHGHYTGGRTATAVGIIGALVSVIAKGLTHVTLALHSPRLSNRDSQWVEVKFSEADSQMAISDVRRRLARVSAETAAYEAVFGSPAALPAPTEFSSAEASVERSDTTVRAAIAAARTVLGPDATPAHVAAQLVHAGILPDPETAVRVVAEHMVRDGAHRGAPQVTGMSKASAITTIAEWCGDGAPSDLIVQILAHQDHKVTDSQVRNELSRARKKAPAKTTFGFGKP